MDMKDVQRLRLSNMQHYLAEGSDLISQNYFSQHLAVVRSMAPARSVDAIRRPFLMDEMRIIVLKKGWSEPRLNLTDHHFGAGELIYFGPNGIAQVNAVSDDVEGIGLSMSNELLALALGTRVLKAFDGHQRTFHFHLEPPELDFIDRLHHLLYIHTREEHPSTATVLHLVSALLCYIDHLWSRKETIERQGQSREQRLLSDFLRLVSRDAAQHHQIDHYASELCLSPRYMSTLVKKHSGKAAKEWIDDELLSRSKVELVHTSKSVVEISNLLGFANPSFFCKFFRRLTGTTPLRYRQRGGMQS